MARVLPVLMLLSALFLGHCCKSGVEFPAHRNSKQCAEQLAYSCDLDGDEVYGCCCKDGFEANATGYCEECSFSISWRCAIAMVVASGASVASVPALLAVAGFTSAGVTGGSLAALWQANMAGIASGGLFSTLQSVAMAGLGWGGTVSVGGWGIWHVEVEVDWKA